MYRSVLRNTCFGLLRLKHIDNGSSMLRFFSYVRKKHIIRAPHYERGKFTFSEYYRFSIHDNYRHLHYCSSESSKSKYSEIDTVKAFHDERIIQVSFNDGTLINFNHIWLRDSCQCPQCVHTVTKTKLLSSADIDSNLLAHRINCDHESVQIVWRDENGKEHISVYGISWLKMFANAFSNASLNETKGNSIFSYPSDGIYAPKISLPIQLYWNSNIIQKCDFSVKYKDLMNDDRQLKKTAESICQLGIAFVEDVPLDKNEILTVARRIAYERRTGYGVTFDVTYNPDPNTHLSYTGAKFEPHVDLAYRERSPGIQMLHCLEQSSTGGQTFLVDGFMCAQKLKEINDDYFKILSKFPVLFSFCDSQRGYWFREKWPIIRVQNDKIKEIHYSEFSMRPPLLPLEYVNQFYSAYK